MKRLFVVGLVLSLVISGSAGAATAHPPLSESSRIRKPSDPGLVSGILENGLQYFIMENTTPKDRVSVHLKVFAGSVHETDDERGIAHFLEHMLFNGSEHFAPGELITYFQSIGMDFGADANARTSFYSTVYDLSLPKGDRKHLGDAFVVIRDYAGGALLLASEVDRERGVILAEKRERDSVSFRTFEKELAFEIPGSLLADRLPIGITEVLERADRNLLKGFYDRWYRPDNMALVVVGDTDAKMAEALVREAFSSLAPRSEEPLAAPDISWPRQPGTRVFHHHEPEAGSTDITIERIVHKPFEPETLAGIKDKMTRAIGDIIFQNRLSRIVRGRTAAFSSASVYSGTYLRHLDIAAVQASCDPENWETALSQLEAALRQAVVFGFTRGELERVKADIVASLDAGVAGASTRKSGAVAAELLQVLSRGALFLSPAQTHALLIPHIQGLSLDTVDAFFRASWALDQRMVMVTGNAVLGPGAEEAVARVFEKSTAVAVAPYQPVKTGKFPYLPLSDARADISAIRDDVNGLGIRQVDFKNQIRLNLKATDFKKGEISFRAVFGAGKGKMPEAFHGLSSLVESAVRQSGFGAMDVDQLDAALAGKEVDFGFAIDDTAFAIEGTARPEEAELVFQLLYAYFNDPGFRASGLDLAKIRYRQRYDEMVRTTEGVMRVEGVRFLAGGDPRFGMATPDRADGISIGDVETWLRPVFRSAPLEVSIAGDLDLEQITDIARTYLGAMAQRESPAALFPLAAGPAFPKGKKQVFRSDTRIGNAVVRLSFPTDDYWDIVQTRRLSLLSQVISERLRKKVREALGASYSPFMFNRPSQVYKGYGVMSAVVNLSPDAADMMEGRLRSLMAELVENGVTREELDLVKSPLMNHLTVLRQNNAYWLGGVMSNSFRHPERLDWATHIVSGYDKITAEDLTQTARQYLTLENSAVTVILPGKPD